MPKAWPNTLTPKTTSWEGKNVTPPRGGTATLSGQDRRRIRPRNQHRIRQLIEPRSGRGRAPNQTGIGTSGSAAKGKTLRTDSRKT
jgi:hypothetical protein